MSFKNKRFAQPQEKSGLTSLGTLEAGKKKFGLDNVATGFSLSAHKNAPAVYRISVAIKEIVEIPILQEALVNILPRFPYYRVSITRGFYLAWWTTNLTVPTIISDKQKMNQYLPFGKNNLLFRVRAHHKRIAIEFHHCLTDGYGSLIFLRALVAEYLSLKGITVKNWEDIFRPKQMISPEEHEYAYERFYKKSRRKISLERKIRSFNIPNKAEEAGFFRIKSGIVSAQELLKKSKEYGVTLTEFLASVYIYSLNIIQENSISSVKRKSKKPIRIKVPVNLRRIFPSNTMRNFSLFVMPDINPKIGKQSFDEILKQIHNYMQTEIKPSLFERIINRNVRNARMVIVKLVPYVIKRFFGITGYYYVGTTKYSGILSNLGRVKMPEELSEHIEFFDCVPGPGPVNKVRAAILCFGDNLTICFGRVTKEPTVSKYFFKKLEEEGIKVIIDPEYE